MDLKSLARAYDKTFGAVQAHKDKTTELVGQGLQAAETVGACYLLSYTNGRAPSSGKDHHELSDGVPTDLTVGVLGHIIAFFGGAGHYGEHLHNLSDGALSAWAARVGTKQGSMARLGTPQQATPGMFAGVKPAYGNMSGFMPSYAGVHSGTG